jgi:hypothetical protein
VRAIEVHGERVHDAVPRTNASRVETNVADAALNPAGTGPPGDCVMPDGAAAAGARAAGRAADGACVVPHPAASVTISSPPHTAENDFFTNSPPDLETPKPAGRLRALARYDKIYPERAAVPAPVTPTRPAGPGAQPAVPIMNPPFRRVSRKPPYTQVWTALTGVPHLPTRRSRRSGILIIPSTAVS